MARRSASTLDHILNRLLPPVGMDCPVSGTSLRLATSHLVALQVLAALWKDLDDVRAWIEAQGLAAFYLLVGEVGGQLFIRVGEGAKLYGRLPDHRGKQEFGFVTHIYVVAAPSFHKGSVIHLQEVMTDLVKADPQAELHARCGPPRGFPLLPGEARTLDLTLLHALHMLHMLGLPALGPAQAPLVQYVASLLPEDMR